MKYLLLTLILTACSLDKNSTYWNNNPVNMSSDTKEPSVMLDKIHGFKKMTYDEFDLFLKTYLKKTDYPDIDD